MGTAGDATLRKVLKILIIGGGIGGMASAIALRKAGAQVDLIDKDPDWRVYGAGVTITGPTLRAFRALGLLDAISQGGFFIRAQRFYRFDGAPIAEQPVIPMEEGLPAVGGIFRPTLHAIMSGEVRKLGVAVRLGVTADALESSSHGVSARFSDGSSSSYDLAIAADGIYSATRQRFFENGATPTYTGQMSWRIVVPRRHEDALLFFGHSVITGIIPVSKTESYAFILEPQVSPVRIQDSEKVDYLRGLLATHGGAMTEVRDNLGPQSSIVQRPFEYALQPAPWYHGRVLLIGDAAHSTTAHLASGAGIAVEDALVISEELSVAKGDVDSALNAFMERRFERCRYVVETSVAIGRMQLSGATPEQVGMAMGQAMHRLAQPI